MADKAKATFFVDRSLWEKFGKIADERGHTRTWYLVGSVAEIVKGQRRGKKKQVKKSISS